MSERDWTRRHIDAFRFHRGHSACTVQGCTGSQPLMWVPTVAEDQEMPVLEAQVIVLAEQSKIALAAARRPKPLPRVHRDHIHWAR